MAAIAIKKKLYLFRYKSLGIRGFAPESKEPMANYRVH